MKSTLALEILCLLLAALVLVWSGTVSAQPLASLTVLGAFAAVLIVLHGRRAVPQGTRTLLKLEAWSLVAFITAVLWLSGKGGSPLLNLYLLPLFLSALTLGRATTMALLAVIAACHVALAAATPGLDVLSLAYANQAVGQLVPFLLVAYLTSTLSADITEAREHIETLAQTDTLTGLYNERTFNEVWQREHATAVKRRGTYALLMIDMDRLQDINEDFGHDGGNSALLLVAQCLERSIRGTDFAGRLGGDEFAVLLPGATPEVADAVVKRVRHNVYKTTLDLGSRMIRCSVSIGVANHPRDGAEMRELRATAERHMYRDKELRRAPSTRIKA